MISLSDAVCGEVYEIKWIMGIAEKLKRLYRIKEGDTVCIVQNAGGDMIINHKFKRLALSKDICTRIKVGVIAV